MYIVRFLRSDGNTNEDYYYHNPMDAINHLKLFAKDTSSLYRKIQLIFLEEKEIVITELNFEQKTLP